jgi:hypothetical protein
MDTRQVSIPERAVNRPTNTSPLGLLKQHRSYQERTITAPADGPVVIEDFDEGWPVYEEPVIIYH